MYTTMAALLPLSIRQEAALNVITIAHKEYRPTIVTIANIPFLSLHNWLRNDRSKNHVTN
jgi:hypothetical protein